MFLGAGQARAPARRADAAADLPQAAADIDQVNTWDIEVSGGLVAATRAHAEATAETLQLAAALSAPSPAQLEAIAAVAWANAGLCSPDAAAFEAFEVVEKSPHSAEDSRARRQPGADKGNLMPARDGGTTKRGRPANKTPKTENPPQSPGIKPEQSDAIVGFEEKLWLMADKLRNNMDAAEYKHVVLGLIFLKYISDAFEEKHAALEADKKSGADPEDPDEYRAETIFWVPKEARWSFLQAHAKQPTIGKLIDDAMVSIERDNATLKGVLPKDYGRPALDKTRLGELIDLVGTIGLGDKNNRSRDVLGRVYEYFLTKFAASEGKNGGQFYTPRGVVRVLVEMLAPYKGRVFDPCCGSGGMFVQSEKFVEAHGGRIGELSVFGQESNHTTWRLAKLNLAIRGIDANIAHGDTFHADAHKDLKADYVLANPPFNDSDWGQERLREDVRWKYGLPPAGNANFAWVQHFLHHLSPTGIAGFVLANGSMSSQQSGEGDIRKALVEGDLVDCMVSLPGQLFYSTQIPVCLWFLARDKKNGLGGRGKKMRNRQRETLFIDARKLGSLVDRIHRELSDDDIRRITDTYHRWRGDGDGKYEDVAGFCKNVRNDEIEKHQFVLTPGRYVGAEDVEDDGEAFETKMKRLVSTLDAQFAESLRLEKVIRNNLRGFTNASRQ